MSATPGQKHSIVFGGTRGIGRVLANSLCEKGQAVTVVGRSAPSPMAPLDAGAHIACDLSDPASLQDALEAIKGKRPAANYLVFCQRWRGQGDSWQGELNTSLYATKLAIESLSESFAPGEDASIVLVSSVVSRFVAVDQPLSYNLAKAAMVQLAQYFAVTLGPRQIRVNVVSPGATIKPESEKFYASNTGLQALYKEASPLGRLGTARDVANVIEFLCSPASSFVTGQNLFVDGGVSLQSQESVGRRIAKC
jgi:NAD(P)-dependent dehydrogenase (short-subunit alcohol dehydrogenase family)